jgi:hypothetical protein
MKVVWPGVWPGRLLAAGLEEKLLGSFAATRHGGVVEPVLGLALVHDELGVGIVALAGRHVGQAGRMIGVHVGEDDRLDAGGIDAGRVQVVEQLAGGGQQVVAGARLHKREAACGINQEGVDLGAAGRAEVVGQDLAGLVLRNVAQHVERAIEEPVADCGDDDIADAAVVDTRYLLLRNLHHARVSLISVYVFGGLHGGAAGELAVPARKLVAAGAPTIGGEPEVEVPQRAGYGDVADAERPGKAIGLALETVERCRKLEAVGR